MNNINNFINQNNQNNERISKSEILEILKKAKFKLSGFHLAKIKSDKKENNKEIRCG